MRGLLLLLLLGGPAMAVQPDEVLDDPRLEERARAISRDLRCPVCQGENIDDSNAAISRDLRLYVRERLVAGDSDAQVVDHVVDRFGEFVLFSPRATGANLVLWLAGPIMALIAAFAAWRFLRGRDRTQSMPDDLDEAERRRLEDLMRGD
ncbi:cytochrome c-type biogenesis protein [Paracoccus zeaxanthinifaciens]|uniref:cytochrome c-type biogenesis protein n=1 Tax=Paracoccus zeaxanthinifaciens TaxID=187400 RepID=UPI0003B7B361|nr:cytochrome c-type biogenesis protein [Paracoccus zeaxanthinifaciens]